MSLTSKQIQTETLSITNVKTPQDVQAFLDNNGGVAVIKCYAEWCGPSKHITPYLNAKHQHTKIPLCRIDVQEAVDLANKYEIQAMPTLLVVKKKWDNVVKKIVGGGEHNVDQAFQLAAELLH